MKIGADRELEHKVMAESPDGEITQLLEEWQSGNAAALDELVPLIYSELRALATRYLKKERGGHTLQPTALVHEAYVRLVGHNRSSFDSRSHFFAVASQAMRRVLVDHARRHRAGKRIDIHEKVPLEETPELRIEPDSDILAVHHALERLQQIHPRQAKLVELRYFGGLTNAEAAEVQEVSLATVERDWKVARIWLRRQMSQA